MFHTSTLFQDKVLVPLKSLFNVHKVGHPKPPLFSYIDNFCCYTDEISIILSVIGDFNVLKNTTFGNHM